MADCIHSYTRKGLHNSSVTIVCWRRWERPQELEPGDCDNCPFSVVRLHLDVSDHPLAFQRRPDPPRRQIPPAKMAERYK